MAKYVALLRGIGPQNPNMHPAKLKGVLEDLGFSNVQTVISSGNVVFETASTDVKALEAQLEAAWPKKLGFKSTTIIRSQAELQKLVKADPYKGTQHSRENYLLVTFFKHPQKPNFTYPYTPPGRHYQLVGGDNRTIFTASDTTAEKTPDVMTWLERQFSKDISSRTWLTIQRILKKMDQM